MNNSFSSQSARQIQIAIGRAASAVLADEYAETTPIPTRVSGVPALQVLFYRESGPPGDRKVSAPDYCMRISPSTGQVQRFWACGPDDFGIAGQPRPVPGAGIPSGMTAEEFVRKQDRLLDIGNDVWDAYFRSNGEDRLDRDLAKEYLVLFLETTRAEIVPWVVESSPDFFEWIKKRSE